MITRRSKFEMLLEGNEGGAMLKVRGKTPYVTAIDDEAQHVGT
jgi:hypothetical protein